MVRRRSQDRTLLGAFVFVRLFSLSKPSLCAAVLTTSTEPKCGLIPCASCWAQLFQDSTVLSCVVKNKSWNERSTSPANASGQPVAVQSYPLYLDAGICSAGGADGLLQLQLAALSALRQRSSALRAVSLGNFQFRNSSARAMRTETTSL